MYLLEEPKKAEHTKGGFGTIYGIDTIQLKKKIEAETASKEIKEKLDAMTTKQWETLIRQLRRFVDFRLYGQTVYGAHTIEFIGEDPHIYYVSTAIVKVLTLERKWDFTLYSLSDQLKRIIGSMISKNIEKYKCHDIHYFHEEEGTIEYLAQLYAYEEEEDIEFRNDREVQYDLLHKAYYILFNEVEMKVYDMVYHEGLGIREIAARLGMDFKELQALKHNAIRRLTRYLIKHFEEYKKNKAENYVFKTSI